MACAITMGEGKNPECHQPVILPHLRKCIREPYDKAQMVVRLAEPNSCEDY